MNNSEIPVVFQCNADEMIGIVHCAGTSDVGVVIVVGGPQYRVGSHRQFVLLARTLAQNGITAFRFDYRGMGDSDGDIRDFENVNRDIEAAIDCFQKECPHIRKIVLWGLCDAASASSFYAYEDPRVVGLVLLNPWVRTASGQAKTYLKHYYLSRLFDGEMWRKLFTGKFEYRESMKSLFSMLINIFASKMSKNSENKTNRDGKCDGGTLPERMQCGLREFGGQVLFILSGDDLTADEFRDMVASSSEWEKIMNRESVKQLDLQAADHTFSRREWRQQVELWTIDWMNNINNCYNEN